MASLLPEIRRHLNSVQNHVYKDYQILRWIDHKKGDKEAVLKTIKNQHTNEDRVRWLLADTVRWQTLMELLNKGNSMLIFLYGCCAIIHPNPGMAWHLYCFGGQM